MRRWWLWYLCAFGLCVVAGLALRSRTLLTNAQLAGTICLMPAVWAGVRRHRPTHRLGWWALFAGSLCSLVVTTVWGVLLAVLPPGKVPSADYAYVVALPPLILAVAAIPGRAVRLAGLLEAGIITGGAAVLWWTLLIDPLVTDAGFPLLQAHVLLFPLLDLALLALGVRLLLFGSTTVSYVLLSLATTAMLAADTAVFVASFRPGPGGLEIPLVSFAGWMVAVACFAAAALHPSMAVAVRPDAGVSRKHGAAAVHLLTVVATPLVTGVYLLYELSTGSVDAPDIVVPVGMTALTAGLVVIRMRQLTREAIRRTAALERSLRTEEALQDELRHRALHDSLTGLPNRVLLHDKVSAALEARSGGTLMVIDLDNFKDVNDRFGHAVGDDLLWTVADRLRTLIEPPALVSRLDSDEFAVLLDGAGDPACAEHVLAGMRRPALAQGKELFVTASIGVRALDGDLGAEDVLRDTYVALHAAKAAGRDQIAVFDQSMGEERQAVARTVERLRGAVSRGELLVHYQPLVRLADEQPIGVEALLRWQPSGERMIPPDEFIPIAEDSGLIVPIGAWVLRESCRVAAEWHRSGGAVVSVNVSPRQLREPDFSTMVLDALRASALPPSALILEITEGVLVAYGQVTERAVGHLSMLREHGVKVAVDDFGTGYSSLAYLRDLPIDHVKIDRSFMTATCGDDPAGRTLVKAIVDLAAGLGLGAIAEGVETAEQVELLRELGCERAQGFYFARPLPAAEAAASFRAESSVSRVPGV